MKYWDIPDAYWPSGTPEGNYVSHEAVCILNPTTAPAEVALTLYFEDRDPMTGFSLTVDAQRTRHVRMDRITNAAGQPVPRDTPYAIRVASETEELSVQYTRVDTTQTNLGLATTKI